MSEAASGISSVPRISLHSCGLLAPDSRIAAGPQRQLRHEQGEQKAEGGDRAAGQEGRRDSVAIEVDYRERHRWGQLGELLEAGIHQRPRIDLGQTARVD